MKADSTSLAEAFHRGEWERVAEFRHSLPAIAAGESARCAEWVALACAELGRMGEASGLFAALARAEPANPSHRVNLGVSRLAEGRIEEAYDVLQAALRRWPQQADLRLNYGLACFATGRFEETVRMLLPMLPRQPDLDLARLYAARALQEIYNPVQAEALLDGWQPAWQLFPLPELYQYAKLWLEKGDIATAETVLLHLIRRYPAEHIAALNLAAVYERENRQQDADALLAALPAQAQSTPLFLLVQGKLLARAERRDAALAQLDRALAAPAGDLNGMLPERFFSEVEFERGRVLDSLKRFAEAYAAFSSANILIRDLHRRFNPPTDSQRAMDWLSDRPEIDQAVSRARSQPLPQQSPVFIVGFPRSGTTLLDQILDAHPALQVLEEKPALEAVVQAVANMPGGYPQALLNCGDEALQQLRQVYWAAVERDIRRKPGTRLVDKYPFNLVRIQLGMTLFPDAQWIFAIRHPCDVVLSCFMQNLRFTESTHGFWSLEQTAEIYERIMSLWLGQRERLRPDCLDLRYEDLVADFESEARRMIDFLGLPWDPCVLAYHEHARTRHISTPSYSQVIKPIYRSAQGRWLRYRQWFGAAEARLEPFARGFGYAAAPAPETERGPGASPGTAD